MRNFDYLSDKEFDLMSEEEFLNYLDEKAKWIRENHTIRELPDYHKRLGTMVSCLASGEEPKLNYKQRKSYGRRNKTKW